jgi:hypothetical protein
MAIDSRISRMTSQNNYKTPRWVKLSGIITIILLLGFVIFHLKGHGFHHH